MKRALLAVALLLAACDAKNVTADASLPNDADTGTASVDGSIPAGADAGTLAPDTGLVSSRAYKGHENEKDTTTFVNAYPEALGTRLDDCQTCHKSATLATTSKPVTKNACDFCHLIQHPDSTITDTQPTKYSDTLNPFGAAYLAAGRNKAGLTSIDGSDADGDGSANGVEIKDGKYPGEAASKPGQPNAPQKVFTMDQLKGLTSHTEFLLANSNKQQYDDYATYKGVKIKDLLVAAGVDVNDAALTGVTIIAPDGYLKDIPVAKINAAYPKGLFYAGLDTATKGATCGFVTYPADLRKDLVDGGEIPEEQWLLLAYEREGKAMDPSNLDVTSGKINGEGPFRLIVPQTKPASPDRGSQYSPTTCNDGYDYDSSKDHNAGDMVRGVIAIRVNPLPAGVEDFDYKNGGWAYVSNSSLIVYGHGITK